MLLFIRRVCCTGIWWKHVPTRYSHH